MKKIIFISLSILLLLYSSCYKEKHPLSTIPPITVIKNVVCQDVALEFRFEQKIDPSTPSSNSLKLSITNLSNRSNTLISSTNPIVFSVNFFKENTSVLENLVALHSQRIVSLDIGERIDTIINSNFINEITDDRIQVDIIACKTLKNTFAGIYRGNFLIPKHQGGNQDTITALSRCIISAEGKVKIWLEAREVDTDFRTRTIVGHITDNGLFSSSAYDINQDHIQYMTSGSNRIAAPTALGDLELDLYFEVPQIIYNSDTCSNLIFDLKKI